MGKRYDNLVKKVEKKLYNLDEAVEAVKGLQSAKFKESVEISIRLGVNPKKNEHQIRTPGNLPHGTGKNIRVLVFAKGEKAKEAEEAGADFVGAEELVEKVKGGFLDFDVTVATPDMMKDVGKIGKVLGPRNLMPNPKSGTVTFDIKETVSSLKKGQIEIRMDKYGIIHNAVGKTDFSAQQLKENVLALMETLLKVKPTSIGSKLQFIKTITLSTTMGPGVHIDVKSVIGA